MANPLFNMYYGNQQQMPGTNMYGTSFINPMQKVAYIMQAMTNPAAFVKNVFPDIPDQIQNNPNQILQYLQRTRGITQQDIQNAQNQIPR